LPVNSCLFLSRRSPTLWHRAVPIHTVFFFSCPRSLAVTGSGAFYLYHRQRDPPGIFIRRSTHGMVQLPVPPLFSVSSRLLAATSTAPLRRSPARGHPPSRLKALARVIAILVRVLQNSVLLSARQLNSNHYPYSEPAIRKVILYCLAHHYMYGVV
jgi:hypothetical protein